MNAAKMKFEDMPTTYNGLVSLHPPRPLRDHVDERNVEEIIAELAGHKLSADQEDYLDLLSDLLLKYQSENQPAKPAGRANRSPRARLTYLVEQSGITPSKLAKLLGCSQPLVSLLLNGKRELSKDSIKKLAAHFKVDASYFL